MNEAKAARKEVKQIKSEVEPIIVKATESDPGESQPKFLAKLVSGTGGVKITDDEKEVLKALANSNYTFRTLSGLSSEVRLDKGEVSQLLKELVDKDWVKRIEIMKDGKPRARWHISDAGRAILASP